MIDFNTDYTLTIAGRAVRGGSTLSVIDPATAEPFAQAPDATRDQLDDAVAAARAAFPAWSAVPYAQRQVLVHRIGELLTEHQESFARLLTREQGKPLASARQEVGRAAHWCKEISGFSMPEITLDDDPERTVVIRRVPLGVVGAIVPWNFPMTLALWKVAPALLAGNTMVLKPSPFTPLTALKLGELLRDSLPPGVLNVVSGGDALGPWMSGHEGIDKIAFTGSTATGRRVMESAARRLKRITLELGGNDPAIVLPDVDVEEIAPQLFWACFANSSQYCLAAKRLYIHESIYDRLAQAIAAYGRTVKVGNGADEGVQMGPVQNRLQYERVLDLLEDCRQRGMTFLLGGEPLGGKGYFIGPTIVDNPPDDSRIVAEEPFGPIVPFLKYRDIDEAVRRANASEYGLGGSVWGKDTDLARSVADRLECGMVWINEIHKLTPHAPLAGHKQSGLGAENSLEGLLSYTNAQTVSTKASPYRYRLVACGQALERAPAERPAPRGGEVLLRVLAAGLCHTDLHLMDGHFDLGGGKRISLSERGITLPHVLGHENVGQVVALGPEASGIGIGDRVLVYPWAGCDACEPCARGEGHLCGSPRFVGVFRPGGFGTHLVVPHSRYLFPLDGLEASAAAPLACSGLTAYSALSKIRACLREDAIVIIGAGGLGLMALALLKRMDGRGAIVIEPDAAKRQAALDMGALAAFAPGATPTDMTAAGVAAGAAAALDFVGSPDSIAQGAALLRKGGRLVVVGMYGGALSLPIPHLVLRALSIEGSYVGSLAEMRELMALVRRTGLPRIPIVARPLSQINDAFADMRAGRVIGRTVLQP